MLCNSIENSFQNILEKVRLQEVDWIADINAIKVACINL